MNYAHHVATLRMLSVTPCTMRFPDGTVQRRPHSLNRAGRRALAKANARSGAAR